MCIHIYTKAYLFYLFTLSPCFGADGASCPTFPPLFCISILFDDLTCATLLRLSTWHRPSLPPSLSSYLAYSDVEAAMKSAAALGCEVEEVEGYKDHVKSLFRKPAAIFGGKVPAAAAAVVTPEVAVAPAADAAVVVASSAEVAPQQPSSSANSTPEYQTFKYFSQ